MVKMSFSFGITNVSVSSCQLRANIGEERGRDICFGQELHLEMSHVLLYERSLLVEI